MKHCTWNEALNEIGRETGKPDAVFALTWCAVFGLGISMIYLVYMLFVAVIHAAQWTVSLF